MSPKLLKPRDLSTNIDLSLKMRLLSLLSIGLSFSITRKNNGRLGKKF